MELEHSHASAGVCRVLVLGGLGDVAVAPKDLARRVFFTADTGDANTPSVVAITFCTAAAAGVLGAFYIQHAKT